MECPKCKKENIEDAIFCCWCGKKLVKEVKNGRKKRGNGQGSVQRISANNYKAIIVIGYDKDKKCPKRKTKSGFKTRTEALNYIPVLKAEAEAYRIGHIEPLTLKDLYEKWLLTHQRSKSTMNCYASAFNWMQPFWDILFSDIGIDDWQECLDDCPKGKRTKENMRSLLSLLYKYAIPRGNARNDINLASYLKINHNSTSSHRPSFSEEQLELIYNACGVVPYADYIYCMCYTGFRCSEFLSLKIEKYNRVEKCLIGGGKTEAGTNRTVTLSPKIIPIIEEKIGDRQSGYIFCNENGEKLRYGLFIEKYFYPAIDEIGIDNPIITVNGINRHLYTPHCCRRTFATLLKRVRGADKDKLSLIGHASDEMLRYYQDINYEDLRKITNKI